MGKIHSLISRRGFFTKSLQAIGIATSIPVLSTCGSTSPIAGKIQGANAALGHRLRTMDFEPPSRQAKADVAIVGGGVAGLSAARFLHKKKVGFVLLEMAEAPGGNSISGRNNISAYPWGAHYLPIPGNGDPELIEFLTTCGVIDGVRNGLPEYNQYFLCHDPKERLYIHNYWQDGIVPHEGVPKKDRDEIERFLEMMNHFRNQRGTDGKPAFTIPVANCSKEKQFLDLASINAISFLGANNFRSTYLHWYVRYCCADDFGTSLDQTSAWAMIHYFASRKSMAFNATSDAVLTWPAGNGWLVDQLKDQVKDRINTNALVYDIELTNQGVEVMYFDAAADHTVRLSAKAIIMATPQFVNQRLLSPTARQLDYRRFQYAPWMVANITTTHPLTERRGEPLCWDNVIFGSESLGYINSSHQNLSFPGKEKVLTYYKPLTGDLPSRRREAYSTTLDAWQNTILEDLSLAHPDIRKQTSNIDVWIWGHGMIAPTPGLIGSGVLEAAAAPFGGKVFFAHSDLSGISIFEEAFYQGHRAANELINYG